MKKNLTYFLLILFFFLKIPGEILHAFEHSHIDDVESSLDNSDCEKCDLYYLDGVEPIKPLELHLNNVNVDKQIIAVDNFKSKKISLNDSRGPPSMN